MKRALMALAVLTLVGCGSLVDPLASGKDNEIGEMTVTLKDGRILECLRYSAGNQGSIDCNWEHPLVGGG